MYGRERFLVLFLRFGAGLLLLSMVPVVMPFAWMQAVHRDLGLGELSASPLNQYLTRSLSGLYAFHGALLLYLSFDVRAYRGLIRFLAWGNIVFGVFMLGLDYVVGLPWFWTAVEGPFIVGSGVGLIWLSAERQFHPGTEVPHTFV